MNHPTSQSLTQQAAQKARSVVIWSLAGAGILIATSFFAQQLIWIQQRDAADNLLRAHAAAHDVLLADERLTMSANMAAATGEQRWIDRYQANIPAIDKGIADASALASTSIANRFYDATKLANDRLVTLERTAMSLSLQGQTNAARAIMDGALYAEQKKVLAHGSSDFLASMVRQAEQDVESVQTLAYESGLAMLLLALVGSILMWRSLNGSLSSSREALDLAEDRLRRMAMHDVLTGLPNRRAMLNSLELALGRARRNNTRAALLMLDLDRFKPINDRHGHLIGDLVLKEIAHRMSQVLRSGEFRARLGGDEFVVIAEYEHDDQALASIAERLHTAIVRPMNFDGLSVDVGCSIGASVYPLDGETAELLMRRADLALYRAKRSIASNLTRYDRAMDSELDRRAQFESELREGLRSSQVVPYFQPLIELATGRLVSFEVLARWHHPTRGIVPPMEFIPMAESMGLLGELTIQILRQAAIHALDLPDAPSIAINIAPQQIIDDELISRLIEILKSTEFPADRLEIELTETALVTDIAAARAVISRIKGLGGRVSLDDFGTGYSSLCYLSELQFDKIKIDRSFLRTLHERPESAKVVNAIISLAKSLGVPTVAEGVESIRDVQVLRSMGCTVAQGYLYSRPLPAAELPELMKRLKAMEHQKTTIPYLDRSSSSAIEKNSLRTVVNAS